jgi:ABC-type sugar transport system permease subunit
MALTQTTDLPAAPARPAATARRLTSLRTRRIILGYLLVAPVIFWRLATSIYPFFYTAYLSFFDRSPVRRTFDFVGLANYSRWRKTSRCARR